MRIYTTCLLIIISLFSSLNGSLYAADSHTAGTEKQVVTDFSAQAGGKRSFYVVLPANYDKNRQYRLLIVFPGTHTTGKEMHAWFGTGWQPSEKVGIESQMPDTLFIYPDQKYAWQGTKGWALGPFAGKFSGNEDIVFIDELIKFAINQYHVDPQKIFATGHSWGGDMAAVVGCFLGDKFNAIAPIAANRPYWFDSPPQTLSCKGNPAVWTLFGLSDDFFGDKSPDGLFGKEQDAFWRKQKSCPAAGEVVRHNETVSYLNCQNEVLLTLYAGGQYYGGGGLVNHQPPDYLIPEIAQWFNHF